MDKYPSDSSCSFPPTTLILPVTGKQDATREGGKLLPSGRIVFNADLVVAQMGFPLCDVLLFSRRISAITHRADSAQL